MTDQLLEGRTLSQKELAEQFSVSDRTIRNDLRDINDTLIQNGLNPLRMSKGLISAEKDFVNIRRLQESEELFSIRLSTSERAAIAAVMLVSENGYTTLASLADRLYISRQTVIKDLPLIRKLVDSFHLEVISQANKGLRVEGRESDKRRLLRKLYQQTSETGRKFMKVRSGDPGLIAKMIREAEAAAGSDLTDHSFDDLLVWLQIMIARLESGHPLESQEDASSSPFYRNAQDLLKVLAQYLDLNVTVDEICSLARYLESLQYFHKGSSAGCDLRAQFLTRSFIEAVSADLGVNLNRDYNFFENLSAHILSVLSGMQPEYPDQLLLQDVIDDNPEVLEAADHAKHVFAPFAKREITKNDLMFISVHILAALEKHRNMQQDLRVIVACHGGIGTSQYLAERLKNYFDFRIVDVISAHRVPSLNEADADLIISTVPLDHPPIESVQISTFFNDNDYVKVIAKTEQLRNSRYMWDRVTDHGPNAAELISKIRPVVERIAPEQAEALNRQLRKVIRDYFREPALKETEIFSPYLHHLLGPNRIQLDVEAADWKEAIRKSASVLVDAQSAEERYVDAMIASIEENGPYIVLFPGFAVPHDAAESGALRTDMNLIRLKKPVEFNHEEHDPVRYVCTLTAADQKTHLKAFFNLVNILQNPEFLEKLDEASTPLEASRVIEHFEYSLS